MAAAACIEPTAGLNGIYYQGGDRSVLCAANIDDIIGVSRDNITAGLDRAAARSEVLQLFAHEPGRTVDRDTLAFTFAAAAERGLAFITYRDLLDHPEPRAGLVFSFDDTAVQAWTQTRDLFNTYGVHATFFVSRYDHLDAAERTQLQQLAADGHAIEAHSVSHARGPSYVETYGLQAYLSDEVLPSISALRADGFNPQLFAYPFGARTSETDAAILPYVRALRSVSFVRSSPFTVDPCPY
ncbi:MAG: polysaccharide deacetylase family protein [Kofleriaceae bacterium]|nr:polysaccharide deacetylase family protein [Kofleriaceae bacterium]